MTGGLFFANCAKFPTAMVDIADVVCHCRSINEEFEAGSAARASGRRKEMS